MKTALLMIAFLLSSSLVYCEQTEIASRYVGETDGVILEANNGYIDIINNSHMPVELNTYVDTFYFTIGEDFYKLQPRIQSSVTINPHQKAGVDFRNIFPEYPDGFYREQIAKDTINSYVVKTNSGQLTLVALKRKQGN